MLWELYLPVIVLRQIRNCSLALVNSYDASKKVVFVYERTDPFKVLLHCLAHVHF